MSSWNEKIGSNTWKELLSFLDDSKIGCITFRTGSPEKKFSENYLIYDESKILRSVFNRRIIPCFSYIDNSNDSSRVSGDSAKKIYKNKTRFVFIKRILREIVWKLSKWKNKTLDDFILGFNPTHIVYFMDGYIHANRVCRYAKRITGAKTIGYFVDDTFSFKQRKNPLFFVHRFFQRRSIRKLVKRTDIYWSINSKMQDEVKKTFKVDSAIVTKPLREVDYNCNEHSSKFPLKILYAGNLGIGRADSLKMFINSLEEVNKQSIYFKVDVFSDYQPDKTFDKTFVSFHQPISQENIFKKYEDADILLFLESIRHSSANIARLSFSTKITDYLSYSKPIIAIGSLNCFPVSYLVENNAALFGKNKKEITDVLMRIISDPQILQKYLQNAHNLGIKNHSRESISKIVRSFFN